MTGHTFARTTDVGPAFWVLAAVTIAALAFTWRREIVRDRNAARARDMYRHPANIRLIVAGRPITSPDMDATELMAAIRAEAARDLLDDAAQEVAEVETVADVLERIDGGAA